MATYGGFLVLNLVDSKAGLDVEEQAKVLAGLGDGDDIWMPHTQTQTHTHAHTHTHTEETKSACARVFEPGGHVPMRPAG